MAETVGVGKTQIRREFAAHVRSEDVPVVVEN
jgi:hypothetical protein